MRLRESFDHADDDDDADEDDGADPPAAEKSVAFSTFQSRLLAVEV
jgi:hypothetical protein